MLKVSLSRGLICFLVLFSGQIASAGLKEDFEQSFNRLLKLSEAHGRLQGLEFTLSENVRLTGLYLNKDIPKLGVGDSYFHETALDLKKYSRRDLKHSYKEAAKALNDLIASLDPSLRGVLYHLGSIKKFDYSLVDQSSCRTVGECRTLIRAMQPWMEESLAQVLQAKVDLESAMGLTLREFQLLEKKLIENNPSFITEDLQKRIDELKSEIQKKTDELFKIESSCANSNVILLNLRGEIAQLEARKASCQREVSLLEKQSQDYRNELPNCETQLRKTKAELSQAFEAEYQQFCKRHTSAESIQVAVLGLEELSETQVIPFKAKLEGFLSAVLSSQNHNTAFKANWVTTATLLPSGAPVEAPVEAQRSWMAKLTKNEASPKKLSLLIQLVGQWGPFQTSQFIVLDGFSVKKDGVLDEANSQIRWSDVANQVRVLQNKLFEQAVEFQRAHPSVMQEIKNSVRSRVEVPPPVDLLSFPAVYPNLSYEGVSSSSIPVTETNQMDDYSALHANALPSAPLETIEDVAPSVPLIPNQFIPSEGSREEEEPGSYYSKKKKSYKKVSKELAAPLL